jgi:hypothetical protein
VDCLLSTNSRKILQITLLKEPFFLWVQGSTSLFPKTCGKYQHGFAEKLGFYGLMNIFGPDQRKFAD